MTITMDAAGRLVIPSEIRRAASLVPGVPLEVRCNDGVIEIEPKPLPVALRNRGRLRVASPLKKTDTLGTSTVERTRTQLAERHKRQ